MITIPKNRTNQILNQIVSVKAYTLDNYFSGNSLTDIPAFLTYLERMKQVGLGKVSFDKMTGKGKVKLHSNAWYEFEVR